MAVRFNTDIPVESLVSELAESIPGWMKTARVPGLAVALIRDAVPVWTAGFGVKSAASEDPVRPDTVFEAASLSKPVFAYHVLGLCERGLLDLDRPLCESMPEPYEIDDPRVSQMTARMALSHTTGFSNRWSPDIPDRREGRRICAWAAQSSGYHPDNGGRRPEPTPPKQPLRLRRPDRAGSLPLKQPTHPGNGYPDPKRVSRQPHPRTPAGPVEGGA